MTHANAGTVIKSSTNSQFFGVLRDNETSVTAAAARPIAAYRTADMAQIPKLRKPAEISKARVLIVDDQPMIRERLREVISGEADMCLCGEADELHRAFRIVESERPRLIITGLDFKESHGLEFIKDLRARYPEVRVLVFSGHDESVYAERAIRAGASGFITKRELSKEVLQAIRQVLSGHVYLSPRVLTDSIGRLFARSSVEPASGLKQLSDRELEVFEWMGRRRSMRQIATALHLDIKTIQTYRSRIKVKLKLSTTSELVRRAEQYVQQSRPSRSPASCTL